MKHFIHKTLQNIIQLFFTVAPCILILRSLFYLSNWCTIRLLQKKVKIYI